MILQLAARVGLDGEVAGVDISADMQARGPERAERHGASNAEFVHADTQMHDFGAARFDAAHSPLAVMFFADPVAASGFDGRTCGARPRTALRHEPG
jgi:ubiquinone/menaquinone biosynthesis C-methylase UbiE